MTTAAIADDEGGLEDLLRRALLADPHTDTGQQLRALARALHVEAARDLLARSADAADEDAEAQKAQAREHLYRAILIEQVYLQPAPAAGQAGSPSCLLDPPPDPPIDVMARATTLGAHVHWSAPPDHGKAITRYDVTVAPQPLIGLTVAVSGTDAEIKGLLPGTAYTFTVTATNADGTSLASLASNSVRPEVTPPGPPPSVTAKVGGAVVTVEWAAPAAGAPFTAFWVTVYDAAKLTPVLPVSKLGNVRTTTFDTLPKGRYVYGVRAFNAGGYGDETRSAAQDFTPVPTPFTPVGLPQVKTDPLELFDLGSATDLLKPDLLQRRLGPALEKANKWRYEYLKSLALNAASETLQYEQFLGQLLQMTLGKVTSAQLLLSPVLQQSIEKLLQDISTIGNVASSGPVQDVVKRVADAAATVMGLEGLIFFLLDDNPLAFWVGLFDGMIRDVCAFDSGLGHTDDFLRDYLAGPGTKLVEAVKDLVGEIDAKVGELIKPLAAAVAEIGAGVIRALREVVDSINETVVAASTVTGSDLVAPTPFPVIQGLIDQLNAEVQKLKDTLLQLIHGLLEEPGNLLIQLIKIFIVYPILAAFVISFALGPIAGAILAAIVVIAAVELIRLVARLLAGPLLDSLNDARRALNDVLGELSGILATTIGLLESPAAGLQQVAAHLLALEQLLPREFMNGVAALIGEARRALLGQATELALAAERALGVENATAFNAIRPNYDSGLPKAPRLPGGADETLLAGMAMLRDINRLDRLRTRVLDPKEVVVTQRLSLFRLLGGLGNPLGATGAAAAEIARLGGGGQTILKLTEEAIVEENYPGLYRAMVVDIKPIGLLATAAPISSGLPVGIPLSVTHLGPSRMRVKRAANPDAPPIGAPDFLRKASGVYAGELLDQQLGPGDGEPAGALKAVEDLALASYADPKVSSDTFEPVPPSITQQIKLTFERELATALAGHTAPVLGTERLRAVIVPVLEMVFATPLPEGSQQQNPLRWVFPTRDEVGQALHGHLAGKDAGVTQLRNALRPILVEAHRRELKRLEGQIAKWAGARYEEDRDPHVRALGYVTLVQDFPVETAAFNLLPDLSPAAGLGGAAPGLQPAPAARLTEAPATALQYRPFENRGVEGDWLLSMESALAPGTLIDLLLEVTIRGCYDERLAAGVKANRDQVAGQLVRAKAVAAQANKALTLPGTLPELLAGASEIRTLHFSLRAHRDSLLTNALAGGEAIGSRLVDGLDLKDGLKPLGSMEPFSPLAKGGLNKITLRFQTQRPQSLGVLGGEIPVTLQTLGIPDVLTQSDAGSIVGIGLVVLPSVNVARPPNGQPPPAPDDFAIHAIDMDPLLGSLLSQLDVAKTDDITPQDAAKPNPPKNNFEKNRGKALFITMSPSATPVPMKTIWQNAALGASGGDQTNVPRLGVDMGDALNKGLIHDVIFSLSVKIPVTQLNVAPGVA